MALIKENTNTAYRLGRLFAILKNVKKDDSELLFAKYIDVSHAVVNNPGFLARQLTNAQPYLSRGEKNLVTEIMSEISEFPERFTGQDEGNFWLGFHHQGADLRKKQED